MHEDDTLPRPTSRKRPARRPAAGVRGGRHLLALAIPLAAATAWAQRADLNAVTAAEDAFGTTTGNQSIGLYSLSDARGFNPQQAGNLRLEGLYYNQTAPYINQCLVRDTSMRVGIAAQSVSFPAPTGVADLHLYVPDGETRLSAVANAGAFSESGALLEAETGLGAGLSTRGCVGYNRNFFADEARESQNVSASAILRWHPSAATEVEPFVALQTGNDRRVVPQVYTDGFLPPPVYVPGDLAVADFTQQKWHFVTTGLLVRQALDPTWSLAIGVFNTQESDSLTYLDEYLSVLPDRHADHTLDIVPPLRSSVLAGEIRLSRRTTDGGHTRRIEVALRGRDSRRDYGGDALVDLGPATLDSPPVPGFGPYATTATSEDTTRQLDTGVSYEERFAGRGSFGVGLLQSHYTRRIDVPLSGASTDRTAPVLGSARFTVNAGAALTFYGSFVQGLEDAQLAPTTAVNRGEPPPATRTHQSDAGLRYAPDETLSVILGGFEIDKAYFNLDAQSVYTELGSLRHRGLESSATWSRFGFTAVAGAVWLKPHVERVLAEPGATGTVPIGPTPLSLTLNLDLAPPAWRPFAGQVQLNRRSGGEATADNRFRLAPVTLLNAGLRYESKVAARSVSVRLDGMNLTNAHGLRLTTVDQLLPEQVRRWQFTVAVDY